ncbi:MAG: hypothetical protein HC840_14130 [Leptolyngbyaceae cyanobacterium RM2_2_4]|nr:hypothetical protein [Leptolyngbyaceae cyanobacterium RM2_2_4]
MSTLDHVSSCLISVISGSLEVQIWQAQGRSGDIYWRVYGPAAVHRSSTYLEAEARL